MIDQPNENASDFSSQNQPLRRIDPAMGRRQTRPLPRASHMASGNDDTSMLKPAFFWWTFCQWWKVIIPVGLVLAGIAAAGVILSYQPDYKAEAIIMVEDSAPYIAFSGSTASGNMRKYVETQVELLRSSIVLDQVLGRPEIAKLKLFIQDTDKLRTLKQGLRISRIGRSELYKVSFISKSPQASADIANAVVAVYLSIQTEEETKRTRRVIDILEEQRARRHLEVQRLRQKVVKLGEEVTGRDPFANDSIVNIERANNPATTLFQELAQLDLRYELLNAEMAAAREMPDSLADHDERSGLLDLEVASAISNHPDVIETENAIAQRKVRMANIESVKKPGKAEADLNWKQLKEQLQQYETILEGFKVELEEKVLAKRTELHNLARRDALDALQRKLDRLLSMREILTQKFDASIAELRKNGGKSIDLEFARADLEREQKVLEMIASRMLAMQTEMRAPTRVRLRLAATSPKHPVAPLPIKMLALACSAALAAPYGLTLLREISVKRISSVEQLSRETQLRILGEVSCFPIKQVAIRTGNRISGKLRRQMFLYNESIDSLRTSLWLANDNRSRQLLAVTSAAAGEGKTSISTSLAMSIANASKTPVLIIDADMRAPDVATVLATENGPGLAELLSKKAELKEVIKRVGNTHTYVIPAGKLEGNPHHFLQGGQLKEILDQLREKFSSIIIDTPPVFGGSEALVFAEQADGVIITTLNDVSRSKQVNRAVEKLEHAGANILGAVLNGRSANSYANSYGYRHYFGNTDLETPI